MKVDCLFMKYFRIKIFQLRHELSKNLGSTKIQKYSIQENLCSAWNPFERNSTFGNADFITCSPLLKMESDIIKDIGPVILCILSMNMRFISSSLSHMLIIVVNLTRLKYVTNINP